MGLGLAEVMKKSIVHAGKRATGTVEVVSLRDAMRKETPGLRVMKNEQPKDAIGHLPAVGHATARDRRNGIAIGSHGHSYGTANLNSAKENKGVLYVKLVFPWD